MERLMLLMMKLNAKPWTQPGKIISVAKISYVKAAAYPLHFMPASSR